MAAQVRTRNSLAGSAAIVLVMLLLGRLAGLARDLIVAPVFGAGASVDSLVAARTVPELVLLAVATGAISSGYLPAIALFCRDGETISTEGSRAISAVTNWALLFTVAVTVMGEFFPAQFVRVVAPGLDAARLNEAAWLLRIMMPVTFFVTLAGILGALLNFRRVFALPSARALVTNAAIIIAIIILAERVGVASVAIGWVLGASLQILLLAPLAGKIRLGYDLRVRLWSPGVERVLKLMFPVIVAQLLLYGRTILERQFASWLPEGGISYLNYAYRLATAPLLIVTNAVTTVNLPELSRLGAANAHEDFVRVLRSSVRLMWLATVPFAVLFLLSSEPLVRILLEHGAFSAADAAITAALLRWYVVALIGGSLAAILAQAVYATGRGGLAVAALVAGLAVQGAVTAVLLQWKTVEAVAIGTGIGLIVSTVALFFALGRILRIPGRLWVGFFPMFTVAGSLAMAVAMITTSTALELTLPKINPDLVFLISSLSGGLAYLSILVLRAPPELDRIRGWIWKERR